LKRFFLVGQQNEGPILERFLKETKRGTTLYTLENMYRPGLVKKSDAQYCKTTVDAFGPAKIDPDGEAELVGIEVKTRTTHRTRQVQIQRRNRLSNGSDCIYTQVDASS
jgi:UDP-N-acetylglucosamine:LPS N-acetylglucosamine transferase